MRGALSDACEMHCRRPSRKTPKTVIAAQAERQQQTGQRLGRRVRLQRPRTGRRRLPGARGGYEQGGYGGMGRWHAFQVATLAPSRCWRSIVVRLPAGNAARLLTLRPCWAAPAELVSASAASAAP